MIAHPLGFRANHFSPRLLIGADTFLGAGVRFDLLFRLASLEFCESTSPRRPRYLSAPVPRGLGLPHCLRKTFTVPELLTSATAAALVTPGAGGAGGSEVASLLVLIRLCSATFF